MRYENRYISFSAWKKFDWDPEHVLGISLAYYPTGMSTGHKYWIMLNFIWFTVYIGFIKHTEEN